MDSVNVTVENAESDQDEHKNISIKLDDSLPNTTTVVSINQTSQDSDFKVENSQTEKVVEQKIIGSRIKKNYPSYAIIGDISKGRKTRDNRPVDHREMIGTIGLACYIPTLEPKYVKEAIQDEYWIEAMQEEFHQFERNDVQELVPRLE